MTALRPLLMSLGENSTPVYLREGAPSDTMVSMTVFLLVLTFFLGLALVSLAIHLVGRYRLSFLQDILFFTASSFIYGLLNWTIPSLLLNLRDQGVLDFNIESIALLLSMFSIPFLFLRLFFFFRTLLSVARQVMPLRFSLVFWLIASLISVSFIYLINKHIVSHEISWSTLRGLFTVLGSATVLIFLAVLVRFSFFSLPGTPQQIRPFVSQFARFHFWGWLLYIAAAYSPLVMPVDFLLHVTPYLYFLVQFPPLVLVARSLGKISILNQYVPPKEGADFEQVMARFHFTPREMEIVSLLLEGRQNKEVANILFLSPHTVRNHIAGIYAKAGIKSKSELSALMLKLK